MLGMNVTIRLLDPPLHEFLPTEEEHIVALAKALKVEPSAFTKELNFSTNLTQ